MLKELWILIKLLFTDIDMNQVEPEVTPMKHFPFRTAGGYYLMMWCGKLIYRTEYEDEVKKSKRTKKYKINVNHESIHIAQAKLKGSWIKYYLSYVKEWLKGGIIMSPASSAYHTIPYEMEAWGNEEDMTYAKNYDGSNLSKYTIDNRKSTYKSHRGDKLDDWKQYCKSL